MADRVDAMAWESGEPLEGSEDIAALVRYGEALQTMEISDVASSLGRPVHIRALNVAVVPANSASTHKLHVIPLPASQSTRGFEIEAPSQINCAAVVEPGLVILGTGKSHSVVNLHDPEEQDGKPIYPVKSFKWHLDTLTDLVVVDGRQVVSGSADGQIYVCDLANVELSQFPNPILSHNVGPHRVQSVACHPTEKHLISWTTQRGLLQLFDVRESSRVVASVQVLQEHQINDHALYRNNAVVGFDNAMLQLVDLRTMSPFKSYNDQKLRTISNLEIHADDWCALYGNGLRCLQLAPLLRTVNAPVLCKLGAPRNEFWRGTCLSQKNLLVSTTTGLLKSIDMSKF